LSEPRASTVIVLGLGVLCGIGCRDVDIAGNILPGTILVAARDTFFTPDTVAVAPGVPIRWTNEGNAAHSVASDDSLWAVVVLGRREWFEVTFDNVGTFPYHCSQHPSMTGIIFVTR